MQQDVVRDVVGEQNKAKLGGGEQLHVVGGSLASQGSRRDDVVPLGAENLRRLQGDGLTV